MLSLINSPSHHPLAFSLIKLAIWIARLDEILGRKSGWDISPMIFWRQAMPISHYYFQSPPQTQNKHKTKRWWHSRIDHNQCCALIDAENHIPTPMPRMRHRLATFIMYLLFRLKRIDGLRSLPISSTCCGYRPRCGGYHERFHAPMATIRRPLSSTSSSTNGNDSMRLDSMDSYLSHLTTKEKLTAEEAQSIKNALSNKSADDDTTKSIINSSIDAYISMNKRKMEIGQSIGNPGMYVRSIVRSQLLKNEESNNPSPAHFNAKSGQHQGEPVGQSSIDSTLQPLLQSNGIGSEELNESCMLALSRCPTQTCREDALKAYNRQKKRREINGTDKISNPSSYVMAVLR